MNNIRQLALDLCLRDDANFANFYVGENTELINFLKNLSTNKIAKIIFLWGDNGAGKTHILTACCQSLESSKNIAYLPLTEHEKFSPEILDNMENCALLCLDDLDFILGKKDWEEAIFAYYNRLLDSTNNNVMLITASASPKNLAFALADLQSRLSSGITFQLQALNDEQKIAALQLRAHSLGLSLTDETAKFLLTHYNRDTNTLFATLKQLDQAALAAKRKLTIPFIKNIL